MNDDRLRARLQALEEPEVSLDPAARERVVAHVGAAGPMIIRRARRMRTARRVGVSVGAIAAAVMLWVFWPAPTAPGPACQGWEPVVAMTLPAEHHLGTRGHLSTTPGTIAHLESDGACTTRVTLERGQIRVQADNLGGGELAVRTDEGEVRVHGTVFTVSRHPEATSVDVEEGRVSWTAPRKKPIFLGPSETHVVRRLAKNAAAVLSPDPDEAAAVVPLEKPTKKRRKLRARETKAAAPIETSVTLIQKAERLRRAGQVAEARAAYRAAGGFSDGTAEAAWIALARYELQLGHAGRARTALRERTKRFGNGVLALEAEWISVRAAELEGDHERAKAQARRLIEKWPNSPQATGAKAWLKKHP